MKNPARATRGIAVAPHSLAAESANAVLREGGNALEAMVAAAATIAVVYPHMNGIGGDSFWLAYAPGSDPLAIDSCGAAAVAATRDLYRSQGLDTIPMRGPLACNTVAGTISGWKKALEVSSTQWGGKMPLSRLLADAIHYARNGCPVTASQAAATVAKVDELRDVPGYADTYLVDGQPPVEGSVFKQPRLADTLERLASAGLDDFYSGEIAQSIARDLQSIGSPLTLEDLKAQNAQVVKPVELQHSSGRVFNMTPPTQGVIALAIVGIADRLGIDRFGPESAEYVHHMVEAIKQSFVVRDSCVTDPAYMTVEAQSLLEPAKLDTLAAKVDADKAFAWGGATEPGDTIWMGVIDGEGRAVSFIQSIYHEFGSGVVLPGTGINWQNRGCSFSLDPEALNALEPKRKPFHTLNPSMALLNDGRSMVYGTMGGDGQPQTQAAMFTRYVQHGMGLQEVVSAPRWLLGRTWGNMSESLKIEGRFSQEVVDRLRAKGHVVEVVGDYDEIVGHAGALVRHPNGMMEGGFDPRSDGAVVGF